MEQLTFGGGILIFVSKEFPHILVVREIVRDQSCATLFYGVGQIAENAPPCLSRFVPVVNRLSRKWICWQVIPIEVEDAWRNLTEHLATAVTKELVNSILDKVDGAAPFLQVFGFSWVDESRCGSGFGLDD